MRIVSILFLSFISVQLVYAESSVDFNSALSELDSVTSEWDTLLKKAKKQSFKKATFIPDCVFPDAVEYEAPSWVCDEPIMGFETSAVGSGGVNIPSDKVKIKSDERGDFTNRVDAPIKAYIQALILAKQIVDFQVERMIQEYQEKNDITEKEAEVAKQITVLESISGKVSLQNMIKSYVEYEKGVETGKIYTSISKLIYKSSNCKSLIKLFVETEADGEADFAETQVSRGQCDFYQIVDDMNASGWQLLKMLKSPGNNYFALVGYSRPISDQLELNMENEKALWQQFQSKKDAE